LKNKTKTPKYIIDLKKKHPRIASGRKNFSKYQNKLINTLKLIKNYFKNSN
tara:strand:+ start:341 stop:493 length:153 start_codon:yes stop_codon:yes gene_type:complete